MRPRRARRITRLYGGAALCGFLPPINFSKMCNCINEIQEKAKEGITKNYPDYTVNYCIINATMSIPPKVGITAFYSAEQKLKNGKTKHVEKEINLIATYCPFCGAQYDDASATPASPLRNV